METKLTMSIDQRDESPEFHELGIPAVHLLRGVLYADEGDAWEIMLSHQSELSEYFSRIGLILVVDEGEGLAYLRQVNDADQLPGYDKIPRIFRRASLGYDATLLCVLLRDEFRRFEDDDLENERCVVAIDSLREVWKSFFPSDLDDVQLQRRLMAAFSKLEKLKFVRPFQRDTKHWEVRRILKSRLPLEQLESLRQQLVEAVAATASDDPQQGNRPVPSWEPVEKNG